VRADYGPLRYLVNSPRFHVWHHDRLDGAGAADARHAGAPCNFAIVLSVWDWVFGTARSPRDGAEQPGALGFAGDADFPGSLLERLLHPLPAGIRRIARGRAKVAP
jgi:sterol desaturase/sphingolipid hydroxylase (fatty acid hydroxylase superfamily)